MNGHKGFNFIQLIIRISLVASSCIYIVFFLYRVIIHDEPFVFAGYIPIYAFLYVQIPLILLFILTALSKRFYHLIFKSVNNRIEKRLFILSVLLLLVYILSIYLFPTNH